MRNPLQINSRLSGQKNEAEVGEGTKDPLMKCYFLKTIIPPDN